MPSAAPCHRPSAGPQKGPITDLGSRRASHSLRVETQSVPCQASACQGRCGLGPGEASRGLPISQAPLRPQGRPRTPPDQGEPPNGLVLPSTHGEAASAGGALRPSLQTRPPRRTGDPYSGPTGVITGPWDQTLERPGPGCILGPRLQLLQRGLASSLATGQEFHCSLHAAVEVSTPAMGSPSSGAPGTVHQAVATGTPSGHVRAPVHHSRAPRRHLHRSSPCSLPRCTQSRTFMARRPYLSAV